MVQMNVRFLAKDKKNNKTSIPYITEAKICDMR